MAKKVYNLEPMYFQRDPPPYGVYGLHKLFQKTKELE